MKEIWKPIKGWEGWYEVSNIGRVKSIRVRSGAKVKILKGSTAAGYPLIRLHNTPLVQAVHIHRLVAQTFVPNPGNLPEVNHKDGNKNNPTVTNLEWCSHQQNIEHRFRVLGQQQWNKGNYRLYDLVCEWCKRPMKKHRKEARFCNNACMSKWRTAKIGPPDWRKRLRADA